MFWQLELVHLKGSVNLYCYSMGPTCELQILHKKLPISSSGLTSVVRVTVPWIDIILPSVLVFRSLILLI